MMAKLLPLLIPLATGGVTLLLAGLIIPGSREEKWEGAKTALALLSDSLLLGLGVWKITPLFLHLSWYIRNPLSLLFAPGGANGVWAGSAAGILLLVYRLLGKKLREQPQKQLKLVTLLSSAALLGAALGAALGVGASAIPGEAPQGRSQESKLPPGIIEILEDEKPELLILNFWASWCGPCRGEMPELLSLHQRLETRTEEFEGVLFYAVNLTETEKSQKAAQSYIRENRLTFPVLFDTDSQMSNYFSITSVPTTIILSGTGEIVQRYEGVISEGAVIRMLRGL
jgi:thiol-disulfide isomerase/thioredoxin